MILTVKRQSSNLQGLDSTLEEGLSNPAYTGSVDVGGTDETGAKVSVTIQFTDESTN